MSEKHQGGRMTGFHGFERETFGEGRKKMTKPVPGHHFGENWDDNSQFFRSTKFVKAVKNCRNNYIKKKKLTGITVARKLPSQFIFDGVCG